MSVSDAAIRWFQEGGDCGLDLGSPRQQERGDGLVMGYCVARLRSRAV
jgi:hypothetical protein